jgi:Protein phosphatase 2C
MKRSWRWAGACSVGSSHSKTNLECQDRASCLIVEHDGKEYLSIVISDGAGSAEKAGIGASIVSTAFQRLAMSHLRSGKSISEIDEVTVEDWIDYIRDRIGINSIHNGLRPRDYAATLVAAIIGDDGALVVHIGDGAIVLRERETQKWSVPSWPFHGEYASTTRFVVDDPQAIFKLVWVEGRFDRVAAFSDGMERLVLDHIECTAPASYFENLTQPLANSNTDGRDRNFSKLLRNYLNSEKVSEATDDDKSFVIGARV